MVRGIAMMHCDVQALHKHRGSACEDTWTIFTIIYQTLMSVYIKMPVHAPFIIIWPLALMLSVTHTRDQHVTHPDTLLVNSTMSSFVRGPL